MSLSVLNIDKKFGQQQVLNDVSFSVADNEIIGFLGPNGAGKSTTMKIMTGFLQPDGGNISICGIDLQKNPIDAKRLIGYLPEHNPLYLDMYVTEYLKFAAGFYQLNRPIKTAIYDIIEQTGLQHEYKKKIRQLSKGYRQRVGLAQALIHNPQVLILDEPTTGLDPNQLIEIRQLIKNIGKGKTTIFSTHILQEVEALCNRAIVINHGKIVANNTLEAIENSVSSHETFIIEFNKPFCHEWNCISPSIIDVKQTAPNTYCIVANEDIRHQLFNFAQQNDLMLLTISKKQQGLENSFIEIVKRLQ